MGSDQVNPPPTPISRAADEAVVSAAERLVRWHRTSGQSDPRTWSEMMDQLAKAVDSRHSPSEREPGEKWKPVLPKMDLVLPPYERFRKGPPPPLEETILDKGGSKPPPEPPLTETRVRGLAGEEFCRMAPTENDIRELAKTEMHYWNVLGRLSTLDARMEEMWRERESRGSSGDVSAKDRVVEAARAWRETVDDNGKSFETEPLIAAVDALHSKPPEPTPKKPGVLRPPPWPGVTKLYPVDPRDGKPWNQARVDSFCIDPCDGLPGDAPPPAAADAVTAEMRLSASCQKLSKFHSVTVEPRFDLKVVEFVQAMQAIIAAEAAAELRGKREALERAAENFDAARPLDDAAAWAASVCRCLLAEINNEHPSSGSRSIDGLSTTERHGDTK